MTLLEKIVDKILSARFLITVFIGVTYCQIVSHAVHFYLESQKTSSENLESFVTGLIMGFSGLAVYVAKAYFDRSDRDQKQEKKYDKNIPSTTQTVS